MLEINFTVFPLITTDRLQLRQLRAEDAGKILAIRSNDIVLQFMDTKKMERLEEAVEFLQSIETSFINHNGITWGITLKGSNEIIGTIAFWRMIREHYRAEIGYSLLPDFWGKGIMLESISAITRFGFEVLKLHSIEANVNPLNSASIKLLDRSGFVKEAHFKENFYFNGKFFDSVIFSLLTSS
ncbi:MAG: GNAT family N-acetyltransferase [Chitinophagales bacterium]